MTANQTAIRKSDVLALALSKGMPLNALSPLVKLPKSSAPLTVAGQSSGTNPSFSSGVEMLARPAWMITFRMGGGDYPV